MSPATQVKVALSVLSSIGYLRSVVTPPPLLLRPHPLEGLERLPGIVEYAPVPVFNVHTVYLAALVLTLTQVSYVISEPFS